MVDAPVRPSLWATASRGSLSSSSGSSAGSFSSFHTAVPISATPTPPSIEADADRRSGKDEEEKADEGPEEIWDVTTHCPTPSRATTRVSTPLPLLSPSTKLTARAFDLPRVALHLLVDLSPSPSAQDTLMLDIPLHLASRALALGFHLSDGVSPADKPPLAQQGLVRVCKTDARFVKARQEVVDRYCGGKYAHFFHLARIMPPGGTLGPDDKLFVLHLDPAPPSAPLSRPAATSDDDACVIHSEPSDPFPTPPPSPPPTPPTPSPPPPDPSRSPSPCPSPLSISAPSIVCQVKPSPTVRFLTPSSSPHLCSFSPSPSPSTVPAKIRPSSASRCSTALLLRVENGHPTPEFGDLRANPRLLLEAQAFGWKWEAERLGVQVGRVGLEVWGWGRAESGARKGEEREEGADAKGERDGEAPAVWRGLVDLILGQGRTDRREGTEEWGAAHWEREVYGAMYGEWKRLRGVSWS